MKILIVTQYFWPENFRITDLAAGLVDRRHDVDVLTGMPNYPGGRLFDGYGVFRPAYESHGGTRIFRIPLVPRRKGRSLDLVMNYLSFAISGMVLGPLRCREKYDCILVYEPSPITVGLPAIVLRSIKGAPLLFWVQDLWPESLSATGAVTSPGILKKVKTLVRFIYAHCDRILVQSEAFKAPIMELGVNAKRLDYFPNSAEALYQPVTLGKNGAERKQMPPGFRVMFAGNIGAAQDFATILDAAERLKKYPDIHFVILGSGRQQAWVKAQIATRGLAKTFHLLGRYPVEAMPRFFSLADAMLVALKKDSIFERTIPAKVQSYMACARPILAALDGEGARVVIESGAGIACGAQNPGALADAVLELYNLPDNRREELGAKGLRYFKMNFERRVLLGRLERMMETVQRRAGT